VQGLKDLLIARKASLGPPVRRIKLNHPRLTEIGLTRRQPCRLYESVEGGPIVEPKPHPVAVAVAEFPLPTAIQVIDAECRKTKMLFEPRPRELCVGTLAQVDRPLGSVSVTERGRCTPWLISELQ